MAEDRFPYSYVYAGRVRVGWVFEVAPSQTESYPMALESATALVIREMLT